MKLVSAKVLLDISAEKRLEAMTVYIGKAYLNAETQVKIYTNKCPYFLLVGIMEDMNLFKVIKALCVLMTSSNI